MHRHPECTVGEWSSWTPCSATSEIIFDACCTAGCNAASCSRTPAIILSFLYFFVCIRITSNDLLYHHLVLIMMYVHFSFCNGNIHLCNTSILTLFVILPCNEPSTFFQKNSVIVKRRTCVEYDLQILDLLGLLNLCTKHFSDREALTIFVWRF